MNEASRWRSTLAQQIAPHYHANPKVRAVALAGSVALGYADRSSDIDLSVFWAAPPRAKNAGTSSNEPGREEGHVFPFTEMQAGGRRSSRWEGSPSTCGT